METIVGPESYEHGSGWSVDAPDAFLWTNHCDDLWRLVIRDGLARAYRLTGVVRDQHKPTMLEAIELMKEARDGANLSDIEWWYDG